MVGVVQELSSVELFVMGSAEIVVADALREGRAAFARQAWTQAYAQLSAADQVVPLGIDDLDLLASSAWLIGRDDVSSEVWARAHSECLRLHDVPRAARFAFWLVHDLLSRGELAQANGWLVRSLRLLDDGAYDGAERGLLLVLVARFHAKQGQPSAAYATACQAAELSDRFDDTDLKVFGRLIRAQAHARRGETVEAAALFDEVMVAVTVGDVPPIAVGIVYCAVIDACHWIFDLGRAREWTAALSRWCSTQPDLVPFRGQCLVHRAEILRLSGQWSQALAEAEHACTWLTDSARQLDGSTPAASLSVFKYPIGAAFYQLAEIHRVQGDFAKAEQAYRQASQYGQSPEPGLALLRLAVGRLQVAEASMRRVLEQPQSRQMRANLLAASTEIMIAVQDLTAARAAADELAAIVADTPALFLRALSAQSMGSVLLAEGAARAALAPLREAWMAWQEIDVPYDAARVRVLLALACRALGDDDAAELELDGARRVFQRLAAAPDVARVNALLAPAVDPAARVLTRRELQVIVLVAAGKTNRAIAHDLGISERTVDRHVSNLLLKLDLSSRSAATAYAYEHGLV